MDGMINKTANLTIDDILGMSPEAAAQQMIGALEARFLAEEKRRREHNAAIDAQLPISSTRVCISVAGTRGRMYLKGVQWAEGDAMKAKKTTWTPKRIQAYCFINDIGVSLARQMSHLVDVRLEKP